MVDLKNPVYESPWNPGYQWKHALLQYLSWKFHLRMFIETGTHWGGTLKAMQPLFDQLYSIELSELWYGHAVEMFGTNGNVHLIHGNSALELPKLLERIPNEPALFWLDAHYSGGDTACAAEDPLLAEIQTIVKMRPNALIVIDDMQPGDHFASFEKPEGWTCLFHGGVVIMQKGLYDISFS